ncbi:glycerophosphodiester phosphodiesterase GDPDL6 isoform X1 [Cryptomeria japonica]|uniref:glycerophosphodiester phosphodiesterase GDPDL6 isoform X1 n=1 Tax=Cryptomeria japonica TaxID=3369 RepID=UPI0027D9E89E|nr:glycerophosphodiester phosphodiesterase GDPDL6 isoform X1 [Cryptomeria japonica]
MPSGKMAVKGRLLQFVFVHVSVVLCLWSMQGTYAQGNSSWQTLSGKAPLVIAHGGLSGLFPDQTLPAYQIAISTSLSNAVMFCDLQLTKDAQGICRTDINLENTTTISSFFPNQSSTYLVNGQKITGYFAIDHTADVLLNNITAIQAISSRPTVFDGSFLLLPPDAMAAINVSSIWLNVQYSKFYDEHNLSMPSYVRSLSRNMILDYVSSTEVGFLRAVAANFRRSKTKLILRFLDKEDTDPSINQTYGSILTNLTFVKTFAAGILVPKSFIWPLGTDGYLQAPTSLVKDAHTSGLEIFAADFGSDEYGLSHNYSYDPVKEYLQFVDNKNFAVDGILTDFPVTASEAIACYAHNNVSRPSRTAGNPLIISHNGASGDYVGSTDIAYQAAIRDGADYIDCSVQITKDGVPFCRESPDLMVGTAVLSNSAYYPSLLKSIPDIQSDKGIFTFDITWGDIQGLQKNIYSPFEENYQLVRNPAEASMGSYMNLTAFLQFAKEANISVLINIENARAIISSSNLDITNATLSALKISGYDNKTDRIMIQSDDSAVLLQFKQKTKFKLIYKVDESNVIISDSSIKEIKTLADSVTIFRGVIFPSASSFFLSNATDVVRRMHSQNLSVFVHFLRNEFPALAFDYFEDPTMEISSFVEVAKVDGLITDFPATASAYLKNACRQSRTTIDYAMQIVDPGSLLTLAPAPAQAPAPALGEVMEPPLPSLKVSPASEPSTEPLSPTSPTKSGSVSLTRHSMFVSLLIGLFILFFASY